MDYFSAFIAHVQGRAGRPIAALLEFADQAVALLLGGIRTRQDRAGWIVVIVIRGVNHEEIAGHRHGQPTAQRLVPDIVIVPAFYLKGLLALAEALVASFHFLWRRLFTVDAATAKARRPPMGAWTSARGERQLPLPQGAYFGSRSSNSIDTPSGARMKQMRTPGRIVVGSRVNSKPLNGKVETRFLRPIRPVNQILEPRPGGIRQAAAVLA